VVVAEAPSDQMEKKVDRINDLEGVLTIYTTYVTLEDELPETDD
jgi:nitrate reductase NapAB chaperone NapD